MGTQRPPCYETRVQPLHFGALVSGLSGKGDPIKASDDNSFSSSKDSNSGPMSPKGVYERLKALTTALDV